MVLTLRGSAGQDGLDVGEDIPTLLGRQLKSSRNTGCWIEFPACVWDRIDSARWCKPGLWRLANPSLSMGQP